MSIKAYAINSIQRKNDKDEVEVIDAKAVFECSTEQFKELEGLGAARKATTGEIAEFKERQAKASGQKVTEKDDSVADAEAAEAARLKGEGSKGGSAGGEPASNATSRNSTQNNRASGGSQQSTGGKPAGQTSGGKSSDDMLGD